MKIGVKGGAQKQNEKPRKRIAMTRRRMIGYFEAIERIIVRVAELELGMKPETGRMFRLGLLVIEAVVVAKRRALF